MKLFDASSVIQAWDAYPPGQFPKLWKWVGEQFQEKKFGISRIALDEVGHKLNDCKKWLQDSGVIVFSISNAVAHEAVRIKALLEIQNDQYGNGVDENDILIIAITKCENSCLISDEHTQPLLPQVKANYKIPAVCNLSQVNIECCSFLDLIKASEQVF